MMASKYLKRLQINCIPPKKASAANPACVAHKTRQRDLGVVAPHETPHPRQLFLFATLGHLLPCRPNLAHLEAGATVTGVDAGNTVPSSPGRIEPKQLGLAGALQNRRHRPPHRRQGQTPSNLAGNRLLGAPVNPQAMAGPRTTALGYRESHPSHAGRNSPRRRDRVRQPNAASVLGIFRRLSNVFKQLWAKGRPKREATSRDWVEENRFNRWRGVRLITQTTCSNPKVPRNRKSPRWHGLNRA